jgi:hypothetical protein
MNQSSRKTAKRTNRSGIIHNAVEIRLCLWVCLAEDHKTMHYAGYNEGEADGAIFRDVLSDPLFK